MSCPSGNRTTLTGLPPAKQAVFSGLRAYFALIQPHLKKKLIGQPNFFGWTDAENFHDLISIELWSDRIQLLLLSQLSNSLL